MMLLLNVLDKSILEFMFLSLSSKLSFYYLILLKLRRNIVEGSRLSRFILVIIEFDTHIARTRTVLQVSPSRNVLQSFSTSKKSASRSSTGQ